MKLAPDGTFIYSPKDLITFLEGDFAAWAERHHAEFKAGRFRPGASTLVPDKDDAEGALIIRYGHEHEQRVLAAMRERHAGCAEIAQDEHSMARTRAAMLEGVPLIYQAHLAAGTWHGYADFLLRDSAHSALGEWSYMPFDSKLARSTKPYFLVQLCAYAELLEQAQALLPAKLGVVLGTGEEKLFEAQRFYYFYRHLKSAFERFQREFDADNKPDPELEASWGEWTDAAKDELLRRDSLRLVARMTRSQVKKLRDSGISTLAQLVTSEGSVTGISAAVTQRLRRQARLQISSRGKALPDFEVVPHASGARVGLALLPPPDPADVFFDLEGFPLAEQGLEYLFGAVTLENGNPQFQDWWAHDATEERAAFEKVVDWLHAQWLANPGMHIYHYASYEVSALTRLMGRYGTREQQVDDLLRGDVFVDLYAVVRGGVAVGTDGYSLKDIEVLFSPTRTSAVTSADGSIVEYQRWIDSGEPRDWRRSPVLAAIRDYNREDCENTWRLAEWLRARQTDAGIAWIRDPEAERPKDEREPRPDDLLAAELLAAAEKQPAAERAVTELVAHLLNYYRREARPLWWRYFDRRANQEELVDDPDCIGNLVRTDTAEVPEKRSRIVEFRFDPRQDTKMKADDEVFLIDGTTSWALKELESLDTETGLVTIKLGPTRVPTPLACHLIPREVVKAEAQQDAITDFAGRYQDGLGNPVILDLLRRRPPRLRSGRHGPLLPDRPNLPADLLALVQDLDGTTLCIQGPPGSGKTHNAAAVIVELVSSGKRVGVCSNSHRAIEKLLVSVCETSRVSGKPIDVLKAGGADTGDQRMRHCDNNKVAEHLGTEALVVGATAWAFARPELRDVFDYIFVDEAGQVSLANAVAVGMATQNLILIGDQMQLAQPSKGTHPADSGLSCFHYYLKDCATVPPDRGVLLPLTWRLHPDICRFISDTAYEGRLECVPATSQRCVEPPADARLLTRGSGIVMLDVEHDGNTYDSPEEVNRIAELVDELRRAMFRDGDEPARGFDPGRDLLVVAPYNAQVRRLRERLPDIRIASVDKFQGQEASVVIVSMCASSLDETPRGAGFLLSPNRLNVAVSRAQCLAFVVSSPRLIRTRPKSVKEIELLNLFCRLRFYASELSSQIQSGAVRV